MAGSKEHRPLFCLADQIAADRTRLEWRVGNTAFTKVFGYPVRLIDEARGEFPLVGLIDLGERELAWNWTRSGVSRDVYDRGFDLKAGEHQATAGRPSS